MPIYLRATAFDPWAEITAYQTALGQPGRYGATASFVGTLRDLNEGDAVLGMTLEHYPGMTEKFLQKIAAEAAARWDILDSLIIHRYGQLLPNDTIVLVAVWATHRAAAFAACRFLIDELKQRAPFWKKETLPAGTRWVEGNTP
jgi:molybdopterin synthase catalytic subunit